MFFSTENNNNQKWKITGVNRSATVSMLTVEGINSFKRACITVGSFSEVLWSKLMVNTHAHTYNHTHTWWKMLATAFGRKDCIRFLLSHLLCPSPPYPAKRPNQSLSMKSFLKPPGRKDCIRFLLSHLLCPSPPYPAKRPNQSLSMKSFLKPPFCNFED